jgi:hypothetical protein
MEKSLAAYSEAQEATADPNGETIIVQIQKLRDIATWLDRVYWDTLPHIEDASGLKRIAATIVPRPGQVVPTLLPPGEQTRLHTITMIQLDEVPNVKNTLIRTAEAFEEAERKAEAARQEFLRFCFERPFVGLDYDDIHNMTAPLTPAALAAMAQQERYDCLDVTPDGGAVFRYFTITPDGLKSYNWDEIQETLAQTNPQAVPPSDYAALLQLIEGMTTVETVETENGVTSVIAPDTIALEQLLNCGFSYRCEVYRDPNTYVHATRYVYAATPVFQTLCALYELQTDNLVRQNYAVLSINLPQQTSEQQALHAEMVKSALLMEMVSKITIDPAKDLLPWQSKFTVKDIMAYMEPGIQRRPWNHYYSIDYSIGKDGSQIFVNEFSFENEKKIDDNILGIAQSMYRNKEQEFLQSLSWATITEILGLAAGRGGPVVSVSSFLCESAKRNEEIDVNNWKVNEQKKNISMKQTMAAMKAGASVTIYQDAITLRNVCVNERELQIALCAYNYQRDERTRLDRETLLAEFYGMSRTGEESDVVRFYVEWYGDCKGLVETYEANLRRVLSQYKEQHLGCVYEDITDLSAEQIIKLNEKYINPEYNLVLEG